MPAKVTLKTLARELGISHMTVSRAINNHPNVSADLRERVLQLAREVGYTQSATAKALRGLKSGTVGLLLPNIVNDFYSQFAQVFADLCAERRLNLVIHLIGEDPQRETQALDQLSGLHADAAIVVPTRSGPDYRAEIADRTAQMIYLIREPAKDEPFCFVGIDDAQAIEDAVAELVRLGHSRIAFVGPEMMLSTGRNRADAFGKARVRFGLNAEFSPVISGPPTFSHGDESVQKLLARTDSPSAILCGGVEISRGALDRLLRNKIRPGRDIEFVAYGNTTMHHWMNDAFSSIDLPTASLARSTFDILMSEEVQGNRRLEHDARLRSRLAAKRQPVARDKNF